MKLNARMLKIARSALDHHLPSDANFTRVLHQYMLGQIDLHTYLHATYGFKKFLTDYGVVRTLAAGDDSKKKILQQIKKQYRGNAHAEDIRALARRIQQSGLSSNSGQGGPGLPLSFCSKWLYVYRPDQLIPYDSYVLKSLQLRSPGSVKTLEDYYASAEAFRSAFFHESGPEILSIRKQSDPKILSLYTQLNLDVAMILSWKMTDKYLWCEHEMRRRKK